MKRYFFSLLIGCLCTVASAAPVSRSQALKLASQFLSRHGVPVSGGLTISESNRGAGWGSNARPLQSLYVVNNPTGGFVIVSGDDSANPVLGYSTEGQMDCGLLSENIEAWLASYDEQISAAANTTAYSDPQEWTAIEPMLTTTWNQGAPYNVECPVVEGNPTWVGCVGTAMAQIMYYWQWPEGETAGIPAYTANNVDYDSLPPTTFQWAQMIPAYDAESDSEQVQAVAHLMHYAGRSVEMSFGVNGSSSYVYKCPDAFSSYLGYDSHVQTLYRDAFSTEEWNELVYNELAKGHPVLYSGQSARASVHAFVCDGYDGEGFFHINWGFGGSGNGWFRLQALNLQERRTDGGIDLGGYTFSQRIVIGIQPPSEDFVTIDDPLGDRLFCDSVRISTDYSVPYDPAVGINDITMYYRLVSKAAARTNFLWGVGVYQGEERVKSMSLSNRNFVTTGSVFTSLNFKNHFKGLADGNYRIVLLSRAKGTDTWLPCYDTDRHYVEMTIADGVLTVNPVNESAPIPDMTATAAAVNSPIFKGDKTQVHAVYVNNDDFDYRGPLYLLTNGTAVACEHAFIPAHGCDSVDFFFQAEKCGLVELLLSADRYGYSRFGTGAAQINEREFFTQFDVRYADNERHLWLGCPIDVSLTLTHAGEGDFSDPCSIVLSSADRPDIVAWSDSLIMYPSERKVITAQVQGDPSMYGSKYVLRMLYSDGVEEARTDSFLLVEAVPCWKAGGVEARLAAGPVPDDVLAVDFSAAAGCENQYQPNANPNTLYYMFGGGRVSPAYRDRNCVFDGHASNIQLKENYGFFVPMSFTANAASFTTTPQVGTDGHGGWFSMVLPFAVDEVYNVTDQRIIDWFRNSEDSLKDFWVKEFSMVTEDGRVDFNHAAEWVAGMPYIVAVPGSSYAPDYLLQGKELRFKGRDVTITNELPVPVSMGDYAMNGAYTSRACSAYFLNAEGTAFEYTDSTAVPFTCWIEYSGDGSPQHVLNISIDSVMSVAAPWQPIQQQRVPVYSPDGCKVAEVSVTDGIPNLSSLPRGVFIIKGRKYVKY